MVIKKSVSRYVFEVINLLFMLFMIVVTLYPLLYVLFASFSDSDALTRLGGGFLWKPLGFNLDAYKSTFKNPAIFTGYMNTIFIAVSYTHLDVYKRQQWKFLRQFYESGGI